MTEGCTGAVFGARLFRGVEVVHFHAAMRSEARHSGAAGHDVVRGHRNFAEAARRVAVAPVGAERGIRHHTEAESQRPPGRRDRAVRREHLDAGWQVRTEVDLDDVVDLERARAVLDDVELHLPSDCPFWLKPREDFKGLHTMSHRLVLIAESVGGASLSFERKQVQAGGEVGVVQLQVLLVRIELGAELARHVDDHELYLVVRDQRLEVLDLVEEGIIEVK